VDGTRLSNAASLGAGTTGTGTGATGADGAHAAAPSTTESSATRGARIGKGMGNRL
jgi:hypothetical protein